jgi:hypothetical protein
MTLEDWITKNKTNISACARDWGITYGTLHAIVYRTARASFDYASLIELATNGQVKVASLLAPLEGVAPRLPLVGPDKTTGRYAVPLPERNRERGIVAAAKPKAKPKPVHKAKPKPAPARKRKVPTATPDVVAVA